ncbi:hypothetical protein FOA52_007064 [Chlamydomonas sp. UWO 241]|nr:hypothetical protein FOA52_007064 [Chlamydomonas sp. UWO 241]
MNDLLGEVRDTQSASSHLLADGRTPATHDDIELGINPFGATTASSTGGAGQSFGDASMAEFFAAVEDIKSDIEGIKALQGQVVDLHEAGKTMIKTKDVKQQQADMQAKINEVSKLARATKKELDELDKESLKARKLEGCGEGSANERTRTTITSGLKKRLRDLMAEFSDLRNRMEDEYRQLVSRRLQTVTGEQPSDADVDKIVEGGSGEQIFQAAMQEQDTRGRVMDVLAEIRERNASIKELLQSLVELHQIFLDMAINVDAQGEMLDNIQKQVDRSACYVKGGTTAIVEAKNLQKNTRKWIVFGVLIVVAIILIIVLSIVLPKVL